MGGVRGVPPYHCDTTDSEVLQFSTGSPESQARSSELLSGVNHVNSCTLLGTARQVGSFLDAEFVIVALRLHDCIDTTSHTTMG